MSERYSKLFSLPENLYAENAPVIVSAGNLLKDNQTAKVLVQLKIKKISAETIKAATVIIHALDTTGKTLDGDAEQEYLDLSVKQGEEFGQKAAVTLPNPSTRGFSVEVKQIVFTDNSTWEATGKAWEPLPTKKSLSSFLGDSELVKQYHIHLGGKCDTVPQEYKDLWLCACGEWNKGKKCYCCGKGKAEQIAFDLDALRIEKDARLEKEKTEREAKEAADKAAAEAKKKKTRTILSIAVPAAVVVITAIILTTKVFIPSSQYKKAVALFEAEEYDEAIVVFESLDGYKDSAEQIITAKKEKVQKEEAERAKQIEEANSAAYAAAISLFEDKEYDEAIKAFQKLGDYKDSRAQIAVIKEAKNNDAYSAAMELFNAGKFDQAEEAFTSLSGYKDSESQILNCRYEAAKKLFERKKYDEALNAFSALGNYRDCPESANTCKHEILFAADVGDTIFLGHYGDQENIAWIVIDKKGDTLFILSKYCLLKAVFDSDETDHFFSEGGSHWSNSTIRKWLNDDFLNSSFSTEEAASILTTSVSTPSNSYYHVSGGPTTSDKIFLLSEGEAGKYVEGKSYGRAYLPNDDETAVKWWLRSPGMNKVHILWTNDGAAGGKQYGETPKYNEFGVRPSMWIKVR